MIQHINAIREKVQWSRSSILVYVEHNLGFEAEHHERALRGLPGVAFYRDEARQRVGVLTTLQVKHAMCTLTNAMLREGRVSFRESDNFVSSDEEGIKSLIAEQLRIYSYQ